MSQDIKAPQFPESIAEGTVATWHQQAGDFVTQDTLLVDIETDKVVLEVVAPSDGTLKEVLVAEGDTVESLAVLAKFEAGEQAPTASASATEPASSESSAASETAAGPAARKMMAEHQVSSTDVQGSGRGGRITKDDVAQHVQKGSAPASTAAKAAPQSSASVPLGERTEKRVPMTRLRARIAERLMDAKNNTAMLTTFNEVNMQPIMALRKKYQEKFVATHGIKLGFMSFFTRACVEALKRFPAVNASIDGNDMVYHGYFDVGVAVSTERGLVVPVLRDVDQKSLAQIEQQIVDFGQQAKAGKLALEDLQGGTFTISNGGTFGSLLSTPILNPPQTAILGMHTIQQRPMAVDGQVVILPMMYLALSYDHRMIDGKDAVQFLVTIKQFLEDPSLLLLDI